MVRRSRGGLRPLRLSRPGVLVRMPCIRSGVCTGRPVKFQLLVTARASFCFSLAAAAAFSSSTRAFGSSDVG